MAKLRERGFDAVVLHRENRFGFKAGALDNGFNHAKGEFFFILDADFVPPRNILKDCIHHFADPRVGMIQTRWGHINRSYSWLTRSERFCSMAIWCWNKYSQEPNGTILQFQRDGWSLAKALHWRSGRLAA